MATKTTNSNNKAPKAKAKKGAKKAQPQAVVKQGKAPQQAGTITVVKQPVPAYGGYKGSAWAIVAAHHGKPVSACIAALQATPLCKQAAQTKAPPKGQPYPAGTNGNVSGFLRVFKAAGLIS